MNSNELVTAIGFAIECLQSSLGDRPLPKARTGDELRLLLLLFPAEAAKRSTLLARREAIGLLCDWCNSKGECDEAADLVSAFVAIVKRNPDLLITIQLLLCTLKDNLGGESAG